ncbi:hypothetical protein [Schleiferia thermophila]|jgi:thiaminase|uniref:Uncharacterized protein n=1 Tax=Schleiferia thermophila TaxID=884107 RepID=A0A369A9M9_9FLAO|nr:hypothetical protein [Schleiferia thermophila]KFD38398.1 hypothetical protein AT05_10515 [Schleiferia thermophila str. Yellowstone]PMB23685.1 hypothetical protein CEN47_18510 [Fischerella thermalis CCMEE 5319]RCX04797.1 hypothetical protein DES35_10167 [Schleiferia thermophila]GCD79675.1 hypothetical protein JCM30197_09220 [Schleiferia thermophila]
MIHQTEKISIYPPETSGPISADQQYSLLELLKIVECEYRNQLSELHHRYQKPLTLRDVELQNQEPAPRNQKLVVRSYVYRKDKKGDIEIRIFVHSTGKKTERRVAKAIYTLNVSSNG